MALQIRRGTNAERLAITPLEGELIYTTDTKRIYVGDGTTAGGTTTTYGMESLLEDTSPQLGGNLDLNGNNITGTGDININGTITATGNINLGDGSEDNVIVGGQIGSNLIPDTTSSHDLGTTTLRWASVFGDNLTITNAITSDSLTTRQITAEGIAVDGQIDANSIQANVIADDSSVIIASSTGNVTTPLLTADAVTVEGQLALGTNTVDGSLVTKTTSTTVAYQLQSFVDSAVDVSPINIQRHRGTPSAPTAVQADDQTGIIRFQGYDGSDLVTSGFITSIVSDGAAVSAGRVAGKLNLGVQDFSGTQNTLLQLQDTDVRIIGDSVHVNSQAYLQSASSTSSSKSTVYQRARGTINSPAAVQTGDQLYTLNFQGHDGSNYVTAARIRAEASGTGASGVVPGRIRFLLSDTDGNITTFLRLEGDDKLANFTVPLETPQISAGTLLIESNNISATNSNDNVRIAASGTGTLELSVPVTSSVGATGAASVLPANPATYIKINVNGTDYVIPAYTPA